MLDFKSIMGGINEGEFKILMTDMLKDPNARDIFIKNLIGIFDSIGTIQCDIVVASLMASEIAIERKSEDVLIEALSITINSIIKGANNVS